MKYKPGMLEKIKRVIIASTALFTTLLVQNPTDAHQTKSSREEIFSSSSIESRVRNVRSQLGKKQSSKQFVSQWRNYWNDWNDWNNWRDWNDWNNWNDWFNF
ncbi:MAG: hypothetical protein AAGI69_10090 [Cyanobacteria bacterium P01_H01_bin.21]